jgi:cytidyltransferase-like protein
MRNNSMSEKKQIIGYTTGVYDMFHIGHLNVIRRAKEQCDYLIVGVSTDELVQKDKGKTPVIPYEERAAIVSALRYVDMVVPQPDKNKIGAWENIILIKCLLVMIGKARIRGMVSKSNLHQLV